MTVAGTGDREGLLSQVVAERENGGEGIETDFSIQRGRIHADLRIGAAVSDVVPLRANEGICFQGYILGGEGFVLRTEEAERLLQCDVHLHHIRRWKNGRDLLQRDSGRYVIDVCGLGQDELRTRLPQLYQHLFDNVRPHRATVRRAHYRENWWVWGESRPGLRRAIAGLKRVVVTNFAAKHRIFQFQDTHTAIDHNAYVIASEDAYILACLQCRSHLLWMLSAGSTLEDRPLWINSTCFLPFSFPAATDTQKARIRDLAEQLDAHRKRQQAEHPDLTMTGMYNVLEKLRGGESLTDSDRVIHEQGLVSVLKQLHDELDAAVSEAYGWPATLTDEQILERLVALNAERAAEEARGQVRWLRPEYQTAGVRSQDSEVSVQTGLDLPPTPDTRNPAPGTRLPWPQTLPEQVRVLRQTLAAQSGPVTPAALSRQFIRARSDRVAELLQTLVTLGHAREVGDGRYIGA